MVLAGIGRVSVGITSGSRDGSGNDAAIVGQHAYSESVPIPVLREIERESSGRGLVKCSLGLRFFRLITRSAHTLLEVGRVSRHTRSTT